MDRLVRYDAPARYGRKRELWSARADRWHAGECELIGGGVGGVAVHIAEQVAHAAKPDEVLVSGTVKDLVAGSGIRLADLGNTPARRRAR